MKAQVLKPELSYLERPLMQDFYLGNRYSFMKKPIISINRKQQYKWKKY